MRSNRVYRWFRVMWEGSGLAMGFIIVFSVLMAGIQAVFPWLYQFIIDDMQAGAGPARLEELALWMLGAGIAQFVIYSVLQALRTVVNTQIQWRARRRVFHHLCQLDARFYDQWRTGDLVTRLSDDAGEKLSWFLCSGVFRAFEALLVVIACLSTMAWIDPYLTLWVVLPLPLLFIGQSRGVAMLGSRYLAVQSSISAINNELSSTFSGIRIVQACSLEEPATNRFVSRSSQQVEAEIKTAYIKQVIGMMYGYGWQAAMVALLVAGGLRVMDGVITIGQYITFEGLVMAMVWPMFDFGVFVSRYKETDVATERLDALLEYPIDSDQGGQFSVENLDHIALNEGELRDGDEVLMQSLNLTVATGEMVAVVGGVGSGKSLIMKTLAGLRPLHSGQLSIGSQDWTAVDRKQRRNAIGFVPQDPVIISTTLEDNIRLGRDIDDGTMKMAMEVSQLHRDMDAFGEGLDTALGERGMTLSGGQQQRLALARALAGRPSILLMDDATAALDADTETAFWEALESVLPDVAAVVVTHRSATIQRADRVIVLDDRQIAQVGTHDDLIDQPGPYRRIYGILEASDESWAGQF